MQGKDLTGHDAVGAIGAVDPDDSHGAHQRAASPTCPPSQLGRYALRSAALAAQVARNPAATPRILRCIATRWPELRGEVARHPAIDRALMIQLVRTHAASLLENPALPARIAAQRSLPRQTLRLLLEHAAVPAWLAPMLLAHKHATSRLLAAELATLDVDAVIRLARDEDRWVRVRAAGHPALPAEELLRLVEDPDTWVRRAAAARGELPAAQELRLAGDPSAEVRGAVAARAQLVEVRRALLRDPEWQVRRSLARNPWLDEEALDELVTDPHAEIRLEVARHPEATAAVLLRLLERPDEHGLWDGARSLYVTALAHPAMPAAGFERVASSTLTRERQRVAESPRAPRRVLLALATRDPDHWVRRAAVQNPGWDPDDAAHDAEVREAVQALERDEEPSVRAALVRRSRDAALLTRRAGDDSMGVRFQVAASPSTPVEVLERLWREEHRPMQSALMRNPATPRPLLREILRHSHEENTPAAIRDLAIPLDELLDAAASWPLERELVRALSWRLATLPREESEAVLTAASDRRVQVLDYALSWCAQLPEAVRTRLTYSADARLRVDLAMSSSALPCLAVLAADDSPAVRLEVARRLGG